MFFKDLITVIDIQFLTDFSDYNGYTIYQTLFDDEIFIVLEKKKMDEDWQIVASVPLPKPLLETLKRIASDPRVFVSLGNVRTSTKNYPRPTVSTILENVPMSTNSYRAKTVVDRLELPTQVKKNVYSSVIVKKYHCRKIR